MKDIAIFGAGGFGREIACLLKSINIVSPTWNLIGFFDDGIAKHSANEFGPILGGISEVNNYKEKLSLVIAIGNPKMISTVSNKIDNNKINFPNIIAPDALLFDENSLKLGKGNIIGFRSVLSCNVTIGDFNIMNTDVFIGHDTVINSYNVFNPSVRISGEVKIDNSNFFGVGSIVLQQKKIGNHVTVGANSTMIRNSKDSKSYFGNPAIIIQ